MTTRFPEAIPLRKITATVVAKSLVKYFTMTGLPTEIQSDQGSNFMSRVFRQTMQLLEIHQVRSSAYHPESQGALERFHQNLKTMLRCYSVEHERDWDVCLPYILFAARDSKQESLGFTPFELVYGHTPRGPLKLVKEKWIEGNIEEDLLGYVARIKSKLLQATSLAKQHLSVAQSRAKAHFDKSAKTREFKVGDQVLLYLPIPKSPLKAKYYGPYKIKRRVSDVCYVISTPDRRRKERVCHINLVKPYKVRSTALPISLITAMDDESPSEIVETKLKNSQILQDMDGTLAHLSPTQYQQIRSTIQQHLPLFPDTPGITHVMKLDVDVGDANPIRQHPYRLNPTKQAILQKEVRNMLDQGIIEPSDSEWSSPCLMVPKPGNKFRVCADLRQVNQLVKGDSFPLPRMDDCIDSIGHAKFITTLDLLKGYYQIPLTDRAKQILTMTTPRDCTSTKLCRSD